MKIRDAVRRNGIAIDPSSTTRRAAKAMEEANVGSLVVVEDGVPVGIVTDRDLVRRAMAKDLDPDARVDGVMSAPLVTIDADLDLSAAFAVFAENAIRRLPVVDAGGLVGVLTVDDLVMDIGSQLNAVARPITAETLFGHRDSPVPAQA